MNTENLRRHLGETVTIRWGTSRGRDSYGYTTCSLRNQIGKRVAACNGGGYDMRGTVLGDWVAATFPNELRALKPSHMPAQSHWLSDDTRVCCGKCADEATARFHAVLANLKDDDTDAGTKLERELLPRYSRDTWECPVCGGRTRSSNDGKRIDDGRYFYGLTFHDPKFDASKAVIGRDCSDRTLTAKDGASEGKTVGQAEAEGVSAGLERYQAVYKASSKHATERHTEPSIDGACGEESVRNILRAIGIVLRKVHSSSKLDVYVIEATDAKQEAA